MAFSTGTSFGTYAIMIPIVLPMAIQFGGGEVGPLAVASFAAVAGVAYSVTTARPSPIPRFVVAGRGAATTWTT